MNAVITSPPYWGLRDYGTATWEGGDPDCDHKKVADPAAAVATSTLDGGKKSTGHVQEGFKKQCGRCGARRVDHQIGLEPTPDAYVARMVAVFAEVRRVLRPDGTCWVNLGDSYAGSWGAQSRPETVDTGQLEGGSMLSARQIAAHPRGQTGTGSLKNTPGLKNKDLVGIPWRVAFALQADGWVLRSDVIWQKPNPMPESVTDRPTRAHEYLFMFSKAQWIGPPMRRFFRISDEDARWLALFLDTEGSIVVKRAERVNGGAWFGAQICLASTNPALLYAAREIVGQGTVLVRDGQNAPMFYYQLSNRAAADLLHRVYPYLIVKQRQARLCIHLQDTLADADQERRTKAGRLRGRTRSDRYSAALERIWEANKELNHFGDPDISWVPEPKFGRWTSARYWYDADAIREGYAEASLGRYAYEKQGTAPTALQPNGDVGRREREKALQEMNPAGRNKRTVWTIATEPFPSAHFATFPTALVEPCVLAGCPVGGVVLDPFSGSGTSGVVALRHDRRYIGIELNPTYVEMARRRVEGDCPMFNGTPQDTAQGLDRPSDRNMPLFDAAREVSR